MVETITAIDRNKMSVDAQTIEHGTTEVNRFIRQHSKFAISQPLERLTNARIERRAVEHVGSIVREKHLQPRLNVRFSRLVAKGAPDQHQRAIADETGDFFFRQNRQVELMADVINGCSQILFRVNQRTIKIKNENGPHGPRIALGPS